MFSCARWITIAAFCVIPISRPASADDSREALMEGFPPPAEMRVTKENWLAGPYNRWGFRNVNALTGTTDIFRGTGPISQFERASLPILDINIKTPKGKTVSIYQWLKDSYTDGFLVLHRGRIVSENYFEGMTPEMRHIVFSISKSFAGNLAGILAHRGLLDTAATAGRYVPELKGSAYYDATIQHLLDMTVGIRFTEEYGNTQSDAYRLGAAANSEPNPQGLALYDVLPTFPKAGTHGEAFHYVTANADVLCWVMQRATGRRIAELLEEEIWAKLGVERDAFVITDTNGIPFMGGGLNATLRDAARFGQMMLQNGFFNGQQIVPAEWVDDTRFNAGKEAFAEGGGSGAGYRNNWWIQDEEGSIAARGVAGQGIYVYPKAQAVIVKFSAWPALGGYAEDGFQYDAAALQAIVQFMTKQN